jgi:tetraacyldisaccharide 4'-kinase
LYDLGIFSSKRFQTPTICVGNLSVGGTGKTPMVEYLIRFLQEDYKVALLSRGYKRKSKGYILASSESTFEDLGDEPYQIHSKFPTISVAVDADRRDGILKLEKEVKPDVVLLDDAFQHRKVKADLNILLTTCDNLFADDWYLPTGSLRDSKSQAKRADYIIVTKCPNDLSVQERDRITEKLDLTKGQEILFSFLEYEQELNPLENKILLSSLRNRRFTLVTGIADPDPLAKYLTDENLSFEHLAFRDHHFFTSKEVEEFNSRELIVTTEKDYMRLTGKVKNMFYLSIRHAFFGDDGALLQNRLKYFMKQDS